MTISINSLLQPMTSDQVRAQFVTGLVGLGIPANTWRKGGALSSILTVCAITFAGFQRTMVLAIGAGFLETATGSWLVLLAWYVYGVQANPATFASGFVTLTNGGGGVYTYAPGKATFLNSTTKQTYTNVNAFTLNALATLANVEVTASTIGSKGSANPGAIDALVTVMLGVTVTNPLSVVGQDAEQDPALRERCMNKLASLSVRGPRNAYKYAVQTAINPITGALVNINRISVSTSSSTGTVTVTCASPSGAPTSDDLTAAANAIEANARPEAVTVNTNGATNVSYSPALIVWAKTTQGLAAGDLQTMVQTALSTFISTYPIGGLTVTPDAVYPSGFQGLFADATKIVAGSAHPSIFLVEGATDLALTAGQVAVDAITVSVRLAASA